MQRIVGSGEGHFVQYDQAQIVARDVDAFPKRFGGQQDAVLRLFEPSQEGITRRVALGAQGPNRLQLLDFHQAVAHLL